MAQDIDIASFSARYLALLRRFPNQLQEHACLIMPAPASSGALVFAVSHNHHYLLFHDPEGFSNGVYQFGLPEEFFGAIGPRHICAGSPRSGSELKLAISNGEYRLYQNSENDVLFDSSADSRVVFTWSGGIEPADRQLRDSLDAILYLHQEGRGVEVEQALSPNYLAETVFIQRQLGGESAGDSHHRWIRLPDDTVRCLTQFEVVGVENPKVHALICVDADMALG
jgi:hypothetical protein